MARSHLPFDPQHPRCINPGFGQKMDRLMTDRNVDAVTVAKAIGVSPEIVRGYRRGFSYPSPPTMNKLETYFDTDLHPEVVSIASFKSNVLVTQDGDDMVFSFRVPRSELGALMAA
jgi:transcriptional regulator with XRE-family HTH domain